MNKYNNIKKLQQCIACFMLLLFASFVSSAIADEPFKGPVKEIDSLHEELNLNDAQSILVQSILREEYARIRALRRLTVELKSKGLINRKEVKDYLDNQYKLIVAQTHIQLTTILTQEQLIKFEQYRRRYH